MTYEMYLKLKQGDLPEGMDKSVAAEKVKDFEKNAADLIKAKEKK